MLSSRLADVFSRPQDFCSRKAAAAGSPEESETWTFMGVLFEDDARRQLLAKLGFSEAMMPQAAGTGAATGGACARRQALAPSRMLHVAQLRVRSAGSSACEAHLSDAASAIFPLF